MPNALIRVAGFHLAALFGSLVMGFALSGCTAPTGPEMLVIPAAHYGEAFDAAVEAARAEGMPPELRDRRSGIIETEAEVAGSLLEPWRGDNASMAQTWENTLAYQRRRARFEFVPAGFAPETPPTSEELSGPDLFADTPPRDLTAATGPLELRVWVYLERAHAPGVRRSTWSRSLTTRAQLEGERAEQDAVFWSPVARDEAYERRLLAGVAERLNPADFAAPVEPAE